MHMKNEQCFLRNLCNQLRTFGKHGATFFRFDSNSSHAVQCVMHMFGSFSTPWWEELSLPKFFILVYLIIRPLTPAFAPHKCLSYEVSLALKDV